MSNKIKIGYNILKKNTKRNLIIISVIIISLVIIRLYNTFSLNTEISQGYIDGIKTFQFIINDSNEHNSITIAEKSTKNISIKISNPDNTKLKYALHYYSSDILTDLYIGYKKGSKTPSKGLIDGNDNYSIDLKIVNLSKQNITIEFGLAYGLENGGELELPSDHKWIEEYNGPIPLAEVKVGSYVFYKGNNGCDETTCTGTNINTDDQSKGYCFKEDYSFKTDGWRLSYIKNNTAYIISAGAIDCISSDDKGKSYEEITDSYEKTIGLPNHTKLLNSKALTYCNRKYAYKNKCNNYSSWAMDVIDFKNITGQTLSSDHCFKQESKKECGYGNDLIDIGSYYWIANANNGIMNTMFYWDAKDKNINSTHTNNPLGVRPTLRLNDTVYVVEGKGTQDDPYILDSFAEENTYDEEETTEVKKNEIKYISDYLIEQYEKDDEISTIKSNDEQIKINTNKSILLDSHNNYRYYGEKPNNYIMFNDELWRIISISNVKKNTDESTSEMRVKIIRNNSIGKNSYDTGSTEENKEGNNDWSKSTLMQQLNDLYYNQKEGICYTGDNKQSTECDFSVIGFDDNAKSLIDDTVYYQTKDKIDISNSYPEDYYKKERTGDVWTGKVGIIYGSDYMYAADLNTCKETSSNYNENSNCKNSWLYKMHNNVISNLELNKASEPRNIYPVVYLKNNITITEGNGTIDNPFIIEIVD